MDVAFSDTLKFYTDTYYEDLHLFENTDHDKTYFANGLYDYRIDSICENLEEQIRRGRVAEAQFWAALLLGSQQIERLMNLLIPLVSNDISIGNHTALLVMKRVHNWYLDARRETEINARQSPQGSSRGVWKLLRNDVVIRRHIHWLVQVLAQSPKTQIVKHILSSCFRSTAEDHDERTNEYYRHSYQPKLPKFQALINQAITTTTYDEALERQIFKELRLITCIPPSQRIVSSTYLLFLKIKVDVVFKIMTEAITDPGLHRLLSALWSFSQYLRKRIPLKKLSESGVPERVELIHAVLLLTRRCGTGQAHPTPFVSAEQLDPMTQETRILYTDLVAGRNLIRNHNYLAESALSVARGEDLLGLHPKAEGIVDSYA